MCGEQVPEPCNMDVEKYLNCEHLIAKYKAEWDALRDHNSNQD